MKKFTFECEQYWYPSSTWEKKTKVIEAENESNAKMQLMYGGISKVRKVRLIKVSD